MLSNLQTRIINIFPQFPAATLSVLFVFHYPLQTAQLLFFCWKE